MGFWSFLDAFGHAAERMNIFSTTEPGFWFSPETYERIQLMAEEQKRARREFKELPRDAFFRVLNMEQNHE